MTMADLPRALELLRRGIQLRCPRCGHGPLFQRYFSMSEQCSICALRFEREPGYFVGAIYVNYAATVLIAIPGYLVLYRAGLSLSLQLVLWGPFCILFPLWFLRYSKSLWLAMDYFFDPGETPQR